MTGDERAALLVRVKAARSLAQTSRSDVARRVRARGADDHAYALVAQLALAVEHLADAAETLLETLP